MSSREIIIYINSKYSTPKDYARASMWANRIETEGFNAVVPCIRFGRFNLADRCDAIFNVNQWEMSEESRDISEHFTKWSRPVIRKIDELEHFEPQDSLEEIRVELEGEVDE